jgi:hypothetical protein
MWWLFFTPPSASSRPSAWVWRHRCIRATSPYRWTSWATGSAGATTWRMERHPAHGYRHQGAATVQSTRQQPIIISYFYRFTDLFLIWSIHLNN